MTLFQKIILSGKYGKGLYIVSAIMTLSASGLVVFYPFIVQPECHCAQYDVHTLLNWMLVRVNLRNVLTLDFDMGLLEQIQLLKIADVRLEVIVLLTGVGDFIEEQLQVDVPVLVHLDFRPISYLVYTSATFTAVATLFLDSSIRAEIFSNNASVPAGVSVAQYSFRTLRHGADAPYLSSTFIVSISAPILGQNE